MEINIDKELSKLRSDFDKYYSEMLYDVLLEFPLGEITNPEIEGFVYVWKLLGVIETGPIVESDKFSAQGLEGKCIVKTSLITALLAADSLPKHRVQIRKISKKISRKSKS